MSLKLFHLSMLDGFLPRSLARETLLRRVICRKSYFEGD